MEHQPWLFDFICKARIGEVITQGKPIHVLREVDKGAGGNGCKFGELTDGEILISARFTEEAFKSVLEDWEDDSPTWQQSLILLKEYYLDFVDGDSARESLFEIVIPKFALWSLEEGSVSNYKPQKCIEVPEVNRRLQFLWTKQRDEEEKHANTEDHSIPATQLLEAIGAQDSTLLRSLDTQSQDEEDILVIDEAENATMPDDGKADVPLVPEPASPSTSEATERGPAANHPSMTLSAPNLGSFYFPESTFFIPPDQLATLQALPEWRRTEPVIELTGRTLAVDSDDSTWTSSSRMPRSSPTASSSIPSSLPPTTAASSIPGLPASESVSPPTEASKMSESLSLSAASTSKPEAVSMSSSRVPDSVSTTAVSSRVSESLPTSSASIGKPEVMPMESSKMPHSFETAENNGSDKERTFINPESVDMEGAHDKVPMTSPTENISPSAKLQRTSYAPSYSSQPVLKLPLSPLQKQGKPHQLVPYVDICSNIQHDCTESTAKKKKVPTATLR